MAQPSEVRTIHEYRVDAYGAVGDGSSHTLTSLGYATLAAAQVDYPAATALTDEADWCAIQGAINAANTAGGGLVVLGPKTYRTQATVTLKANVSIKGVRPRTRIKPTWSVVGSSYPGLTVQTGTFSGGSSYITASSVVDGLWIEGAQSLSYPTGSTTAGLLIDGSTMVVCRDVTVSNYPIGLDLINNCYNTSFYNFTVPRFASCELGINLRTGGQSGSDLYFYKTHLSCWQTCVSVAGGGGGYYFHGFQFGNVNTTSSDGTGVFMFGWDWATQTAGGTATQILFEGGSVEGPHYNWVIRGKERFFATFRNVSFSMTVSDATKMLGFLKWELASNGRISFLDCEIGSSSYFANDPCISISGSGLNNENYIETDWRTNYTGSALVIGSRTLSGFGTFWGMLWANGLTYGRAQAYQAYMSDGRWFRKSSTGVFEWADDPTGTWKQMGVDAITLAITDEVTAFTIGSAKATYRMPYAFKLTGVRASLSTAQTSSGSGGIVTVDINEGGTSLLGTKLSIDNGEKTSTTAASAATITDSNIADDAEITVDIDQVGDGTARGLKVTLIGYRN